MAEVPLEKLAEVALESMVEVPLERLAEHRQSELKRREAMLTVLLQQMFATVQLDKAELLQQSLQEVETETIVV